MSAKGIATYRLNSVECHQRADKSIHPDLKDQWLRLASDWQKMAENAGRQPVEDLRVLDGAIMKDIKNEDGYISPSSIT